MPRDRILEKPQYCQYTKGPCDQSFDSIGKHHSFFMYSNEPLEIAQTIEEAISKINRFRKQSTCKGWKDIENVGRMIFCEICKTIRSADCSTADITTLNFNVLFEMGFSLGLGVPLIPIRDDSFVRDKKQLQELGLFDTIAYKPFRNSDDILPQLSGQAPAMPISEVALEGRGVHDPSRTPSIFLVRSPYDTERSIRILASLNDSAYNVRVFDTKETPRLSLHEAFQHIADSVATVAHLIDPSREGADVHNARAAFVSGLSMARQRHVLMLQDGDVRQPIDYRDVVMPCRSPGQIKGVIAEFVRNLTKEQERKTRRRPIAPRPMLLSIDLGEVSAENEVSQLKSYFVSTAEYAAAKRGRARLIIGRKGAGKTAIFYRLEQSLYKESEFVVALKPEGHQLIELKELITQQRSEGLQDHTLTAFWHYLLLMELAYTVLEKERRGVGGQDKAYVAVKKAYERHAPLGERDFSERLLSFPRKSGQSLLSV